MSQCSSHRRALSRPLRVEPLELRAMCAALPYHADFPIGTVYGAIDRPDGTMEVIGTRPGEFPAPIIPVEAIGGLGDQCVPYGFPSIPLVKWTIGAGGSVSGPSDFNSQANAIHGFAGVFSRDGSWLAGNLPPTTCGGAGLPIIWHPGHADYDLVGLPADRPGDRAVIQGVSKNGSVIYYIDQEYFAWNQDTGLIPLRSLYDLGGNQSPEAQQITLYAISADGQTIVGTSGGSSDLPRLPTVWRNGVASALPTGAYSAGFATSVSDNGRVIGGNLRDGNKMIAAVWADGVLQQIAPPSGGFTDYPNILGVESGLGGDANGWAAVAFDWGRLFVVRSDGVVNELWHDDPNNFGLSTGFGATLRHFSTDTDSLNLVTLQDSPTGMCAGFSCYTSPPVAHVYSIPLNGSFNPSVQYDLSGDGEVSAQDVLIVINAINANPNKHLSELSQLRIAVPKIDVDGDGELSPSDALRLINYLNQTPTSSSLAAQDSEGEAVSSTGTLFAAVADEYFSSLSQPKRKR